MVYQVHYHPLLHKDIQDAVDWYNEQKEKLGNELFYAIQAQIKKVIDNPFAFSIIYAKNRHILVPKFPYAIHYTVNKQTKTIIIKAVFHTSRDPKIWEER